MLRTIKFLTIMTVILLPLSGCWSQRELNELAIVLAIGIDKSENGVDVSVQVVNPGSVASQKGGSDRTPIVTYHIEGGTVFEAIRKMTTMTPRKLYFSHIQMFIIGEELAKDGIRDILDYFSRDHEIRSDFYVAIAKDSSAEDILHILTPLEKIPASKMYNSLKGSEASWAPTVAVKLHELATKLETAGSENSLPTLSIVGDPQKGHDIKNVQTPDPFAILKYGELGIFKKDKLVGYFTEDESKGYNYIKNNVKNTIGVLSCKKEGKVSVEIMSVKTDVKAKVNNSVPSIEITTKAKQNIAEVECNVNLSKQEEIDYFSKKAEDRIRELMTVALTKAQKQYKSDVFGFGHQIYKEDPKFWKTIEKDWDRHFENLKVTINVEVTTIGTGTINNSFIPEAEKK